MTLSVVTTMYQSARHLDEFCRRAGAAAAQVSADYEIVLVNDGSPDDSLDVALDIQRHDARVRVIDLSRNFGHHAAMMEGLRQARGSLVFLLDSDLEEAPEWLGEFQARLAETNADAVYGVQITRKGGLLERVSGWLFYNVLAGPLRLPWQANAVTARLMTRRFVDALTQFREREMTLVGVCALTGFVQHPVTVQKISRGSSTYNFPLRIAALVNSVTSFSNRPLVLVFELGCAIMAVSSAAALYIVWRWLVGGVGVAGYASLFVSIWFLGGLMVFCIGLVGIYLSKVFIEVKQRPPAIVREHYPPRD
jgi:putative glycosyltransferase